MDIARSVEIALRLLMEKRSRGSDEGPGSVDSGAFVLLCARGDLNSCPCPDKHHRRGAENRMKSTVSAVVSAYAYLSIRADTYSVPHRLPHEQGFRVARRRVTAC